MGHAEIGEHAGLEPLITTLFGSLKGPCTVLEGSLEIVEFAADNAEVGEGLGGVLLEALG